VPDRRSVYKGWWVRVLTRSAGPKLRLRRQQPNRVSTLFLSSAGPGPSPLEVSEEGFPGGVGDHFRKSHISKLDPFLMVVRDFALLGVIIVWNEVLAVRRATRGSVKFSISSDSKLATWQKVQNLPPPK
jgi:hypothetical protein